MNIQCIKCVNGRITPGCKFKHPSDWAIIKDPHNKSWRLTIRCTKCKNGIIRPNCNFLHPTSWIIAKCKFGDKCANVKCRYEHND